MPALRIKHPNGGVITHVLRSERVTIGRAPDNSIQIPHASISSHHAEIIGTDGRHRLRDLQSTNHTSVDGERITERELTPGCRIIFGSIECEYDAAAMTIVRPPEPPPLAATTPQLAQLENENFELRAHVTALQRRFDILGSARLTTGKSDHTPFAANHDAIRDLTTERDELRQQAAGLRQEIGRLRDDIAVTVRERDAARLAAAGLQTERTEMQTELQQAELRIERLRSELIIATEPAPAPPPVAPPPRPPASIPLKRPAPPAAAAREVAPIPPPAPARARSADAQVLPRHIGTLRERITQLAAAPADRSLLLAARGDIERVLDQAAPLGAHPLRRLAGRFAALLTSLATQDRAPATSALRTLRHAAELLERLLDPSLNCAASELPTAQILAIDDDPSLLDAVAAALTSPGLEVSSCITAEEAMIAIEALQFDTIIADIGLPGINGTDFCAHARSRPAYRRTPILFLTGADSLDKRAETSLNGGTEFISKPFDTAELSLKVEAWSLKHQLQLA